MTESNAPEDNKFDVVIDGTGLTTSILSAAASWAGKRILHVDKNNFYGDHWAALSIDQLDGWVRDNAGSQTFPYNSATLSRLPISTLSNPSPLQASRAYSIDIFPHLLYCSSDLVSCLANTRLGQYLEFKALEHIFIFQPGPDNEATLQKVPSSREDIFTSSLSLQEKRKLMKFLSYASNVEEPNTITGTIDELLSSAEYDLPVHLRNTIQYAIALSSTPDMATADAIPALRRHLSGFGVYGGFSIIVPLYGGGGELSQAFCRAAAVKGATYILGREIINVSTDNTQEYPVQVDFKVTEAEELPTARCKKFVRLARPPLSECVEITQSVTVIEGELESLFVENTAYSDAALIVIPPGVIRPEQQMPIQIIIHGGGTGECPVGQCEDIFKSFLMVGILYFSVYGGSESSLEDLSLAEKIIFKTVSGRDEEVKPLLRLTYKILAPKNNYTHPNRDGGVAYVNPPTASKDFDDAYHDSEKLFLEIFGEEQGFLANDEADVDNNEE